MAQLSSKTINVPAMRLRQFGATLYQAILGAEEIEHLVRFEVLGYEGAPAPAPTRRGGRSAQAQRVNWEVLERRIAATPTAYQRPVIKRKIAELTDYYTQCAETGTLPAIPGAVLLVANERLRFTSTSVHRVLGLLQIPADECVLRALDGQHRLLALHNMVHESGADDVQVPAVIFDGHDLADVLLSDTLPQLAHDGGDGPGGLAGAGLGAAGRRRTA